MYVEIIKSGVNKSCKAFLVRESYRDNGKVKKRTLCNITKLPTELQNIIIDYLKNSKKETKS